MKRRFYAQKKQLDQIRNDYQRIFDEHIVKKPNDGRHDEKTPFIPSRVPLFCRQKSEEKEITQENEGEYRLEKISESPFGIHDLKLDCKNGNSKQRRLTAGSILSFGLYSRQYLL